MRPEACARCDAGEPELGHALCPVCIKALDNPAPPPRPENGKPVGRHLGPRLPNKGQQPTVHPRKP